MTAQPAEISSPARARRLTANSSEGRAAADKSAQISAAVIDRLRRQGLPVPGEPA